MDRKPTADDSENHLVDQGVTRSSSENEARRFNPALSHPSLDILDSLLRHTSDGILICDKEGTPVAFNEAYARLIKEALGIDMNPGVQPIEFLEDPEAVQYWEQVRGRAMNGERFRVEFSHEFTTGDLRTFEFDYSPILVRDQFMGFIESAREITRRKQDELESARLMSQLKATLEATADGILVVGLNGRINVFSKRFQKMLGIPDSIMNSHAADQILAYLLGMMKEPEPFYQKVRTVAADLKSQSLDTLHLKNGRILEVYSRPQQLGNKVIGRVWSVRDVTTTYSMGKALAESEELLNTVMNGVSTFIGYIDSQERFVFANQAYADWYGLHRKEMSGKRVAEIMSSELYRQVSIHIANALSGLKVSYENRVVARDGAPRCVEVTYDPYIKDGAVKGIFVSIFDVTEQKRAEERLRKAEEELKFILDKVPVLIWQKDREGSYVQVNKAFCTMHGLSEDEIIGKTDYDVFNPWLAERYVASDRGVLDSGKPHIGFEDPHQNPSNGSGWTRKDKFPYLDTEGNVAGTIGFALDITAYKESQEALKHSEELLKAQNELRNKNQKLQELNTTLNVLLEKRGLDESKFQEKMASKMRSLVYPYLKKAKRRSSDSELKALLKAVHFNLAHIADQFASDFSSARFGLTPTEIRVADLVRQGHKSKDIADLLGISYKTVESHRERIRKKLGITNKRKNLRSFLLSIK